MRRRTRGEDDRRLLQRTAPLHGRRALLGRSAAAAATAIAGVTLGQQRSVAAAGAYPSGGFVDVRDFGAVGDGTVDDTAAIQAAIDSLRTDGRVGGGITFPPGDYRLTDSIRVDYGTTLQGVNAALSRLVMTGGAPKDLVVGAGGFPAYALLRDLTLDGGLESQRAADVPTGNGTCRVVGPLAAGVPVDEIQISGSTCPIGIGDVLRTAGQPPIVVISGPGLGAGEDGRVRVCGWAPSTAVPENGARWHVYREGSLVRGIGRLTVERCLLMRAKRHAIELQSSTQGNISACEIGNNQGAGLFSWASTDYTLSRTWTYRNGGPDVFTYAGADIRISDCILEGSASTSITAHYSDLDVRTTGIWGGRTGLIRAHESDNVRLSDLKLRSPGYGKPDDDSFASPGFAGVAGVPAIDVHLQEHGCGLQAMQLVLREALPGTGPIVWLRNGRRSNISNVEWFPGLTFQGGHPAGAVIRDEGQETLLRACRGAADRHAADRDAVNGERPAGEQRAKADELP